MDAQQQALYMEITDVRTFQAKLIAASTFKLKFYVFQIWVELVWIRLED